MPLEFMDRVSAQFRKRLPFVVYKKPKQPQITALFQSDKKLHSVQNFTETGFVMAAFGWEPTLLLQIDEKHETQFDLKFFPNRIKRKEVHENIVQKRLHLDLVRRSLVCIKEGDFQKVVLSRKIEVDFGKNPLELFQNLLPNYPNAFCYLWFHPKTGLWIGATPEILLRVKNKVFTTISLAGTQPYKGRDQILWGKKELEEQNLVTDYILEVLKDKAANIQKGEIESVRAGNLWHLRTKISGVFLEEGLGPIIKFLHPTPAICGFPKQPALDFIHNNEDYDREFYTGFLGELNFDSETNLYVNLRCAQIKGNKAMIYIGGGITQDSDPEREWEETVAKSRTLLEFM
ncbi:chorismate-binding protein [Ulvibacterium sp.]|uniref:chorismate-binding protein n=1 Tax=Ulvibacterium sp. TaxID=2665914 RepID=UPI00261BA7AB|nr:chorismate-binding protein [Ulvibacterium sp.]